MEIELGNATPAALGTASSGTSGLASRQDHIHPNPGDGPAGPYAVQGASYVVLANHADLTAERVLTGSSSIQVSDGGANSTVTISLIPGGIDHGALDGLGDDDHTQYLLAAGTRQLTGNWNVGNFKIGINSTPSANLDVAGMIRATGVVTPASGAGLELSYSGGVSYLESFDRTGAANRPLGIYGSVIYLMNANVGIGIQNPAYKLVVHDGTAGFQFDTSTQTVGGTFGSAGNLDLVGGSVADASPGGQIHLGGSTRGDADKAAVVFKNNGTEYMRVDGNQTGHTIGNVGIGVTAPSAKAHIIATTEQIRLGYDASNYLSVTVGSGGNATFAPTGDWIFDPTGNDILPNTGYDLNLGSLQKKYLTLHAAELWVETLVAQNTIATIGGRILVGPTTTLTRDLLAVATTIYVKHNEMASGDRAYLEANGSVEFLSIDSAPTLEAEGDYSYTVTRNLDGSGANAWYAGDAMFNTGTTGDGFIDLYSLRSVKSATQYGPAIVGNVRNSGTFNDWTERWAIGELNGVYGYGVSTWGVAFGEYAANKPNIRIDSTNGIRIFNGTATQLGQWDTSGNILVGQTGAGQSNVYISAGQINLRNNTTTYISLDSSGNALFGRQAASNSNVYISSGGVQLRNNTTVKIDFQSDGDIFVGTDTSAAATTNLAIFTTAQTYNSESVDVGDLLLGDNSASKANIFWDKSAGKLNFRGGTTTQAYVDTTGAITAGAGALLLDANGLNVAATSVTIPPSRQYRLQFGATPNGTTKNDIYLFAIDGTAGTDMLQMVLRKGTGLGSIMPSFKLKFYDNSTAMTGFTFSSGSLTLGDSDLAASLDWYGATSQTACNIAKAGIGLVQLQNTGTGGTYVQMGVGDNGLHTNKFVIAKNNDMSSAANLLLVCDIANRAWYINDDANGQMTSGLTINQGAADNEILALKSSDVAHGATAHTETDTFAYLSKINGTGGLFLAGFQGTGSVGLNLKGAAASDDTGKTTSAAAYIQLIAMKTPNNNPGADANLVCITHNDGTRRFLFDAEGSAHADVEWTTYDTHDDIALVRTMEQELLAREDAVKTERRLALEAAGIIGKDSWHMEDGKPRAMVNFSKLSMLHHGALLQMAEKITRLEEQNRLMATQLAALKPA